MIENPKRPWFRFHLLTLVLMMLAAGGWIGLNMQPPMIEYAHIDAQWNETVIVRSRGWPVPQERVYYESHGKTDPDMFLTHYLKGQKSFMDDDVSRVDQWRLLSSSKYDAMYDNVAIGIVMLLGIALVSEFIIRRREARKI
jgi:hypothetical protein